MSVKLTRSMILFIEHMSENGSSKRDAEKFLETHKIEIKKFYAENKLSREEIELRADEVILLENKHRHVPVGERCGSRHAGSSTCSGCESREWILTPSEAVHQREAMINALEKGWRK